MWLMNPSWQILKDVNGKETIIPRDVAMQWNSTYDMLEYCVRYRAAMNRVMQRRDLGLRMFELTDEEWKLAEQLHDSLKVCFLIASAWHLHSRCHLTCHYHCIITIVP